MLQYLGVAWTAWKLGTKRFGRAGAVAFALLAVVGFAFLRGYLEENHPEARRTLDAAV